MEEVINDFRQEITTIEKNFKELFESLSSQLRTLHSTFISVHVVYILPEAKKKTEKLEKQIETFANTEQGEINNSLLGLKEYLVNVENEQQILVVISNCCSHFSV